MSRSTYPRPPTHQERALLHHPDRRAAWIVVLRARLDRARPDLESGVANLADAAPIVTARWRGGAWVAGAPPRVVVTGGDEAGGLLARFDLAEEAPLRVGIDPTGTEVVLAAHHAAIDGRGLATALGLLLDAPGPVVAAPRSRGGTAGVSRGRALARADRVAPSAGPVARETFAARELAIGGPDPTARLAAACAGAARRHNARRGARWRRVGISIGVGGEDGVGNTSGYRRVDVAASADVAAAVVAAIARPEGQAEVALPAWVARLAAPVTSWLSDSFLLSNLGRLSLPGVDRLEFFPVARGRSAVSFGAVGLAGGPSTLTLRARDLDPGDAAALLADAVGSFSDAPST